MKEVSAFIIIFTIIMSIYIYYQSKFGTLTYVTSTIDNNKYLVRNEKNKVDAANKLAKINKKVNDFTNNLINKYNNSDKYDKIIRIKNRYNPNSISENIKNSNHTSYSINKGEKMVLCIRQKEDSSFVDDNTIIFVVIHELAHIMSKSIGHTDEFWSNFKFLLKNAEEFKLYKRENYNDKSKRYCGININDNPIYD